jgi:hypothetical protein
LVGKPVKVVTLDEGIGSVAGFAALGEGSTEGCFVMLEIT